MTNEIEDDVDFPVKLQALFDRTLRYIIAKGGRGGAKSWGFARAILLLGCMFPGLRVLCAREVMKSLDQSVMQLLKDQIVAMNLGAYYKVQNNKIIGPKNAAGEPTLIIFAGLQSHTADSIKSYEGIDICWVEEAHTVKSPSWKILIPTIRKEGSQIWVSFNPELDTDSTYVRFIEQTPPNSAVIDINWRDNPWFPATLEAERKHAYATLDKETYDNIWEGIPRTAAAGAIYTAEVAQMIRQNRYKSTAYDPTLPVHTVWDLGWNDQTSIILFQKRRNEIAIIDYLEASFVKLSDWVKILDLLPYHYGVDMLPWDGNTPSRQSGKSDKQLLRGLGRRNVKSGRQIANAAENRISRTRLILPLVYMDNTSAYTYKFGDYDITRGCGRLMECLKRYVRNVPVTTDEPTKPKHDEFSHGADAIGELAVNVERFKNETASKPLRFEHHEQSVDGVM